jgi:hypothetical protein
VLECCQLNGDNAAVCALVLLSMQGLLHSWFQCCCISLEPQWNFAFLWLVGSGGVRSLRYWVPDANVFSQHVLVKQYPSSMMPSFTAVAVYTALQP